MDHMFVNGYLFLNNCLYIYIKEQYKKLVIPDIQEMNIAKINFNHRDLYLYTSKDRVLIYQDKDGNPISYDILNAILPTDKIFNYFLFKNDFSKTNSLCYSITTYFSDFTTFIGNVAIWGDSDIVGYSTIKDSVISNTSVDSSIVIESSARQSRLEYSYLENSKVSSSHIDYSTIKHSEISSKDMRDSTLIYVNYVRNIKQRGFAIKHAIEYKKFEAGL